MTDENDVDKQSLAVGIKLMHITGVIEGYQRLQERIKATSFDDVLGGLVAFELMGEVEGIFIVVTSPGGDVEAGLAIAEGIAGLTKPAVSLVLGGALSISVSISVAAKKSFIAPSASMIVHPVRMA